MAEFSLIFGFNFGVSLMKISSQRTLKTAYHRLREEALKQFAKAHRNDPDWEPDETSRKAA